MEKKILLVDDDKDLLRDLDLVLTAHGYQVQQAHSATAGLRAALAYRPDVIILDVMMEKDTAGFEFVYQLRSERDASRYKEIRDTPVIFLTAIHQVTNFRFSLNEQASFLPPTHAMLTKPVQIEVLLAKLNELHDVTSQKQI